jgi:ankyrin repeat protein
MTALHNAVRENKIEMVELLLQQKDIDINLQSNEEDFEEDTALHYAIYYNHLDIVKLLLEHKADVNCQNYNGETPFHYAIQYSNIEMVELLLKYDADDTIYDKYGYASIHYVVLYSNDINILKLLLDRGADCNSICSYNGNTPLHYAYYKNRNDMIHYLIEYGANTNIQNENGVCPKNMKKMNKGKKKNYMYD